MPIWLQAVLGIGGFVGPILMGIVTLLLRKIVTDAIADLWAKIEARFVNIQWDEMRWQGLTDRLNRMEADLIRINENADDLRAKLEGMRNEL